MGHDLSQIESNLCVLIVPANVCKSDVKFYMTLLAQRMRFRGVCVLQDSISACYASVSRCLLQSRYLGDACAARKVTACCSLGWVPR